VVVDDIDMAITHVLRGDDHVNNTPRQINIYARSERRCHGSASADDPRPGRPEVVQAPRAVSVLQYDEDGFLPERCSTTRAPGWSHGDDEKFSRQQLIECSTSST